MTSNNVLFFVANLLGVLGGLWCLDPGMLVLHLAAKKMCDTQRAIMKYLDFQFVSDSHHSERFRILPVTPCSRFLLLAGDIGNPFHTIYDKYIEYVSGLFEEVYVILGNHEYYRNEMPLVHARMREICRDYQNVYFLDNEYVDITTPVSDGSVETVRLFGGTLWSNITPTAAKSVNDYQYIQWDHRVPLTPEHTLKLHRESVDSIKKCCLGPDVSHPCIVMTHHAAHDTMNGVQYQDSANKSAFVTHLSELYHKPIVAFINGHTHVNLDHVDDASQILFSSNCLGYPEEHTGFSPQKRVRVVWEDDGSFHAVPVH